MNKADVGRQLIYTYPGFKLSGFKKGAVRITPLDKSVRTTMLDHTEMILRAGFEIKSIISPGELNSKSSKFNTYEILDTSGYLHQVVFGLGSKGNMGMDFERKIVLELQEFLTNGIEHTMVSSFKITEIGDKEFMSCWSLENLQPLWGEENIRKSNKVL